MPRGLQEAVGHFDRVRRLFAEDQDFLRAMFVATFEGVKTTSPLRQRVQRWLQRGIDKVEAGLRTASATDRFAPTSTSTARPATSARPSSAPRSCGSCWRMTMTSIASSTTSATGSFATTARLLADSAEEPLRRLLDAAGEEMPDMAPRMPVQLAAPPFVQHLGGLAHRHPVMPGAHDEAAVAGRGRLDIQWSTTDATDATSPDRSSSMVSRTDGPHRPRCWAIIALSPKIGV